tara:strand:+ start:361 stop:618 length:258 start_codon:yes stop_codon:yes gene_type:complete
MVQIEEIQYDNKRELAARERHWFEVLRPTLNNNIPNRGQAEYRGDNREVLNEKQKEKFTCPCGGRYTRANKSNHLKSKKHLAFTI